MKRSPLKAKRDKPRRNEGRVKHGRSKPKAGAKPTAEQERFREWVRAKGCMITGQPSPTIHHVTSDGYKRISRSHWLIVPLVKELHQSVWDSKNSVEALGHAKFNEKHGVDLLAHAKSLYAEWLAKEES